MASSPRCRDLAHPDLVNFAVSVFIVAGILVSYLPQHYKIIAHRSSRGLSPLFVLLGTVSGTASIANILTLPQSTRDMACCRSIGTFPCAAALLGIVQIGVQWACFFFIMLLFLVFFPRNPPTTPTATATTPIATTTTPTALQDTRIPSWKEAVLVLALSAAFFIFALIGSVVFVYALPSHLQAWANFLGLLATVLAAVQYIPQIHMTWALQETGSLSIPMMCIQTPGSFVFAASLYSRLGLAAWSAWGLFIFTGCLQGCLLAMSLFMWRASNNAKVVAVNNSSSVPRDDARTPLLRHD